MAGRRPCGLCQPGGDSKGRAPGAENDAALADFYERWKNEPLVIDKWFALQGRDPSDGALGRVMGLTAHPAFDQTNPNRLRAKEVQDQIPENAGCTG